MIALSFLYTAFFLAGGAAVARLLLPRLRPLVRGYIGLSLGVLMMMWLPALWACAFSYGFKAHIFACVTVAALCGASFLLRDRREARRFDEAEKRLALDVVWMVLPLLLISAFLQYTHSIRPDSNGGYSVGQSTYGDLSLHLAVTTSALNAEFPLHNSLMLGATMAYPYLSDTIATSMYLLGQPLSLAMSFTGTLMMGLVYTGYALLCSQLCRRRGARFLAFFLLFLNGGLGFVFTMSATVKGYSITSALDKLKEAMTGYYMTPTNQPDPNNLRWVNVICDMLIPQRGILGGWTLLLPCLNLLLPPLCKRERHDTRALVLLGLFAGGMPLVHTHSYLALALLSVGVCAYTVLTAPRGERFAGFKPWLLYGTIAAALSLPQLIAFTFVQATGSSHFLRFQFNWCNNRGARGLVDGYFIFYLKNIGLPYLLILLAATRRKPKDAPALPDDIRQNRMLLCGAFLIYAVAEFFIFQPNEYDNNKLLYVWFMLCLPMAADYAGDLYSRLRGAHGRAALAALALVVCFLSSAITVARECVSDYEAYNKRDVQTAAYINENLPEHSVFITGNQHLNPVSSLAGRTILCSSGSYLYFHGFDTTERTAEVAAFYKSPAENLSVLSKYGVDYIYVSEYERANKLYELNEGAIEGLFPLVYESEGGKNRIFAVPEELLP